MIKLFKAKTQVKVVPAYFEITKQDKQGEEIKYNLMFNLSNPMNLTDTGEYYEKARISGDPLPLNSIQTFELFEDIGNSRNNQLKKHIKDIFKKNIIGTTSIAEYNPFGQEDRVIHNYGTCDEISKYEALTGPDCFIEEINYNLEALESIVGTKDIKKLNKISKSINKTPMYFEGISSRSDDTTHHRIGFHNFSNKLTLDVNICKDRVYPTFLVEQK